MADMCEAQNGDAVTRAMAAKQFRRGLRWRTESKLQGEH
jgi:hypothetical protein